MSVISSGMREGGMIKHAKPSESSEDASLENASPSPSLSPTRRERLLQPRPPFPCGCRMSEKGLTDLYRLNPRCRSRTTHRTAAFGGDDERRVIASDRVRTHV